MSVRDFVKLWERGYAARCAGRLCPTGGGTFDHLGYARELGRSPGFIWL